MPIAMRFTIPRTRRTLVPRRRALHSLQNWRDRQIISIVAPAGYGKTTLVSEWLHAMPADDRPHIAWWSISESDAAPDVFLKHMLTALRDSISSAEQIDALIAAAGTGQITPTQIVQQLAMLLPETVRPILFVLDDFHFIRSADVHALLQTLIDEAPQSLHFVVLSRASLPPRLTRQRLSNAMLDIGVLEMRFDHDEFEAFIHNSSLADCSAAQLADIEKRSDGWIAALQMFALAGERGAVPLATKTFVPEFLQHEVLNRLPHDLHSALTRCALLSWIDAPSLAAVLQVTRRAADDLLQRFLHANLLLQVFGSPTQPTELALRLHPLLRDHLLAELERDVPTAELQKVRERAAYTIAENGDVDAALALLTGDEAAMVQLLARHTRRALRRNERATLRRWLNSISDDVLATQPQAALDVAWLSYMTESGDQYDRIALAQRAISMTAEAPSEIRNEWIAELHVLNGLSAVFANRPDEAIDAFHAASETPHHPDGLAEAYRLELSVHLKQAATTHDKDQAMQRSSKIFRRIGFMHLSIESMIVRALLLWQQSDVPRALLVMQEAAAVTELENLELSTSSAYLYYIRGEILYCLDRISEARQSLLHSQQISRSIGEPQSLDYWSHILLQLCDHADSIEPVIHEALETSLWVDSSRRFMPLVTARNTWLRIRRDAALGRLDHIDAAWRSLGVHPTQLHPEMSENIWFAVLNGALYSSEDQAVVESSLCTLIEFLNQRERRWAAMHAYTLLALLYARTGRTADARTQIAELLPILERNRCPRFLLEYPDLLPFIAMESSLFAQSMLQRAHRAVAPSMHPFDLSDREVHILRLLASGRGTKEISRSMHIAITTLRAHTNNIYHKLGVHSRAEAVRVARAVGLGTA
jgi:LuxR family maltose regulon positive regulatory protein